MYSKGWLEEETHILEEVLLTSTVLQDVVCLSDNTLTQRGQYQ